MISPEAIDLNSLPSVELESKSELPEQSAIYFAIDSQGAIQYIGRSSNLKNRWINHHRFNQLKSLGGVRIAYLFLDLDLLPSVEKALIEWFKPALNNSDSPEKRKRAQQPFTPAIADPAFDELMEKLKAHWGIENRSQLITLTLIDYVKTQNL